MEYPTYELEEEAHDLGYKYVVGVDEAGRGPGAGPVVAAAVCIPDEALPELLGKVNDSKKMTPKRREKMYDYITEHCSFGVQDIGADVIDEVNILEATKAAMRSAVEQLEYYDYVLVDGTVDLTKHLIGLPLQKVIKGDAKSVSIAAASVVAKVTRDRIMIELDKSWGIYNFKKNKGYLVPEHIEALKLYGPCIHHRLTFKKVKDFI
jgi:ribonuclease HII